MRKINPLIPAIILIASFLTASATAQNILWDNGVSDGVGAVSNRDNPHRSLLDDFIVPDGPGWIITNFQTWGIWVNDPPGSGDSFELIIWSHIEDHPNFPGFPGPDQPIATLKVISYEEQETGRMLFSRPELLILVGCEPYFLQPGKYWLEMHMVSSKTSFAQLERSEVTENSYWVDYEDFGGLQPSQFVFGSIRDLAWNLRGTPAPCLNLTVDNLIAGKNASFTITNGTPGARAITVYGTKPGQTIIKNLANYCATFGIQNINQSKIIGGTNRIFGPAGNITFNQQVPKQATGLTLLFQSAEQNTCPEECTSNLVEAIVQ